MQTLLKLIALLFCLFEAITCCGQKPYKYPNHGEHTLYPFVGNLTGLKSIEEFVTSKADRSLHATYQISRNADTIAESIFNKTYIRTYEKNRLSYLIEIWDDDTMVVHKYSYNSVAKKIITKTFFRNELNEQNVYLYGKNNFLKQEKRYSMDEASKLQTLVTTAEYAYADNNIQSISYMNDNDTTIYRYSYNGDTTFIKEHTKRAAPVSEITRKYDKAGRLLYERSSAAERETFFLYENELLIKKTVSNPDQIFIYRYEFW